MKRKGTSLVYSINGAKFKHSYDFAGDALARAEVLVRNRIQVKVKHFALKKERA